MCFPLARDGQRYAIIEYIELITSKKVISEGNTRDAVLFPNF